MPDAGCVHNHARPHFDRLDGAARALRLAQVALETLPSEAGGLRQLTDAPLTELLVRDLDTTRRFVERVLGNVLALPDDDRATLLYITNQGCVTPHVWLSKLPQLERPDRLIFDLDPAREPQFKAVCKTAGVFRAFLDELELPSFPMLTGSRGLHIVIPLRPESDFDSVRGVARQIADTVVRAYPDTFIQTHVSENRDECRWVGELFPQRRSYLDVYDHYGLMRPRAMYGHCIWLDDTDFARMAETGSAIAHCPTSNLFLGSGLFDIARADHAGALVSLGTDVGAGTSFSILQTMNEAYKVARLKGSYLPALRMFYLATLGADLPLYAVAFRVAPRSFMASGQRTLLMPGKYTVRVVGNSSGAYPGSPGLEPVDAAVHLDRSQRFAIGPAAAPRSAGHSGR